MIPSFDLHTHTTYCDGKNSPAEMAAAALAQGMSCLGFSGHCYTFFDESYCMSKAGTEAYRSEIAALREQYAGRLRILCGIEQDYWSGESTEGYDYVIGSVHYVKSGGDYLPVDESPEHWQRAVDTHFGGDPYAFAEAYFETVSDVVRRTGCTIIGHFDLISKFIERTHSFDESNPRYVAAWQSTMDRLLPYGVPFEINTGAMSRGYRTSPYPNPDMIRYLCDHGGKLILSSDSHSGQTLRYHFSDFSDLSAHLIDSPDRILRSA